ncbi:MAG TPA: phosphatidic acid phosphatase [Clostridiaceae bacterium]|nr:phosphatidic acid phosphatase [Clostridiaceae bacterium]
MARRFFYTTGKHKHMYLLFLFLIQIIWFFYDEKVVRVPKYIMFSNLDTYIPFVKEFVVMYVFWYFYMVIAFIYLGITSPPDFCKLFIFIFAGMTIAHIVYLVFPNGQNLRPYISGNDIFSKTIKYIYSIDTPTNVSPSVHVINSIGIFIVMAKSQRLKKNTAIKILLFMCTLSITMSTLFIKQHSIVDVFYSIIVSALLYILIYKFKWSYIHKANAK